MHKKLIVFLAFCLAAVTGCSAKDEPSVVQNAFHSITADEAKQMMETEENYMIVDVRTQQEYDDGHIPDAICIPNEEIGETMLAELPDKNQILFVYCRSGRRSKEACEKLNRIGYTNVYDFGGIQDWKGVIVKEDTESIDDAIQPVATLVLEINGKQFYPELEDNSSARAFFEKLESDSLTVEMHDYGNFEKVGDLPWSLPTTDTNITTEPGDIILYQGNRITIYYDENTWNFTKLAKIKNVTKEELLEVLGEGDVTVSFWLEWSE